MSENSKAISGLSSLVLPASSKPSKTGIYLWQADCGTRYLIVHHDSRREAEYYGSFYYLGSLDSDFVAIADRDLVPLTIWPRESARLRTLLSPPDL